MTPFVVQDVSGDSATVAHVADYQVGGPIPSRDTGQLPTSHRGRSPSAVPGPSTGCGNVRWSETSRRPTMTGASRWQATMTLPPSRKACPGYLSNVSMAPTSFRNVTTAFDRTRTYGTDARRSPGAFRPPSSTTSSITGNRTPAEIVVSGIIPATRRPHIRWTMGSDRRNGDRMGPHPSRSGHRDITSDAAITAFDRGASHGATTRRVNHSLRSGASDHELQGVP